MIRAAWVLAVLATPVMAEGEFSEGSTAMGWGVAGEEQAFFSGEVVDLLCTLTGDCPSDCGGGARQLGILRDADGVLVLVAKNGQPAFTGAAKDLVAFCGQQVEVDGNLVGDPDVSATKIYQIQKIRPIGTEEWQRANQWTKIWNAENPDLSDIKGPWFRKDPRIQAEIEANGYLGLGPEAEVEFIQEWLQ